MARHAAQPALVVLVALVTALAPAGRADAAGLKSLQSGTTTSTVNGTVTVNIDPVDTSKAFLIFQTRHNANRPTESTVRGRIASSTTLEFARVTNASGTIEIQWYVAEFVSGVKVQRGSVSQNPTTINIGITAVGSLSQAFVTWSKTPRNTDYSWSDDDPLVAELTTTSNLQFRVDDANIDHTIWWQVVEFTDAADINVQKGSTSLTSGASSTTVTLPTAVDTTKTFVLIGFRAPGNNPSEGIRMLRARLTSSTQIVIDRSATGEAITEIVWQAVEMKDGTTVTSGNQSFATGESQKTVSLGSVDLATAVPFASTQSGNGQCMGRTPYVTDDIIGVSSFTFALSGTTLTIDRNSTVDASDVSWFVVEWNPAPFTDVTSLAGLSGLSSRYAIEASDYNADGYPDVYVAGPKTLYTNNGDGTFSVGPAIAGGNRCAHWGDFDNDGDPDFITTDNPSTQDFALRRNEAGASFTQMNHASIGIDDIDNVGDGAWFDLDKDGWLDLYGPNGTTPFEKNMYMNDGDGTFTRVPGDSIGLDADLGDEVTTASDYDGDGDIDILLRELWECRLFSGDGDGTFTDVTAAAGISLTGTEQNPGWGGAYDGAAFGDYDNDGDMDLFACQGGANKLYENNGDGTFTDVTAFAGVAGAGTDTGGPAWGDYDHDGDLDLFVSEKQAANHLYRNNGDGTFTDVAAAVGLDDTSECYGADWEDYDNDGDLDLFVAGRYGTTKLFRNNTNDANYLRVRLLGDGDGGTNVEGRGVRVELYDSSGTTLLGTREAGLGSGFGLDQTLWPHFGGVDPAQTYMVRVHFLAGTRNVLVVPGSVSTTIGATVVPQMITVEEMVYRVIAWEETDPN